MDTIQNQFLRLRCFELMVRQAKLTYEQNPQDADVSPCSSGGDAHLLKSRSTRLLIKEGIEYLEDAVSKLEEALELKPKKHDALWCLGNAYLTRALFIQDISKAKVFFDKATDCFQQAVDEAPSNHEYKKSLEFASENSKKSSKKKLDDVLKYGILGCIVLTFGLITGVSFTRRSSLT